MGAKFDALGENERAAVAWAAAMVIDKYLSGEMGEDRKIAAQTRGDEIRANIQEAIAGHPPTLANIIEGHKKELGEKLGTNLSPDAKVARQ